MQIALSLYPACTEHWLWDRCWCPHNICDQKINFSGTFPNTRGRLLVFIPLSAPEKFSSLKKKKSRILLFNAHLALFEEDMITVNLPRNSTIIVVGRPGNYKNRCGTGEECECEELLWRRGSPLEWRVMCFVSSSCECCHFITFY